LNPDPDIIEIKLVASETDERLKRGKKRETQGQVFNLDIIAFDCATSYLTGSYPSSCIKCSRTSLTT
jgi:hypothetical protein